MQVMINWAGRYISNPVGTTGKTLFRCSLNEQHKLTPKQAQANGWMCSHCGAEVSARKEKLAEMHRLADSLGYKVTRKDT